MAKRRLTALVFVVMGVAALAGCGAKSSPTPASNGGTSPTTLTPVTSSGGGGNGY